MDRTFGTFRTLRTFRSRSLLLAALAALTLLASGCEVIETTTTINGNCAASLPAPWGNGPYTQTVTATATPATVHPGGTVWIDLDYSVLPAVVYSERYAVEYRFPLSSALTVRDVTFPSAGSGTWTGTWRVEGTNLFVKTTGRIPSAIIEPPHLHIEAVVDPNLGVGSSVWWESYEFTSLWYDFDLISSEAVCAPTQRYVHLISIPVVA